MDVTQILMLITILVYLAAMVGIGAVLAKQNQTTDDFYLGGRTLGPLVTAMSAEASDMSSWLLMGLPGVAYLSGTADAAWTAIGLAIGTYVNWLVVAKRLRNYTHVCGNSTTLPLFFSNRYRDNKRILSVIAERAEIRDCYNEMTLKFKKGEGDGAQEEGQGDNHKTDNPVHSVDTLEVTLAGKDVGAVDQKGHTGVDDVLDGQAQGGDGHRERDSGLSALAQLNSEGAGEHAANRLIRWHVSADGNRTHEEQLEARADGEAGLQVPEDYADERAQNDRAERIERTELIIELTESSDKSDEDRLNKHCSSF